MTAADDLKAVTDTIPELTDFGIGIYSDYAVNPLPPDERSKEFEQCRASLAKRVDEFERLNFWLSKVAKSKRISETTSSYGAKHRFERGLGFYISNGLFIAVAIHCGFRYEILPRNPNVYFNFSWSSIDKILGRGR